jgi:3-hydroxybutyryl-CoA dehydrogenase
VDERLGIAGSGEIACGLATVAAAQGDVVVWARSSQSAERASQSLADTGARVTTDLDELGQSTFVVEAVVEDYEIKAGLLVELHHRLGPDAILATTTSSLSVQTLAQAAGRPQRFAGLHVFNPVPRMELVELAFPATADSSTRERTLALCEALGKTAVEVPPDLPGFVVNRLLFPYLFDAVRLLDDGSLAPEQVDECMKLGAGHPMGPLKLLDLVGLDVALAIGEAIDADVPDRVRRMARSGELGRKSGRGFYPYD